MSLPSTVTFAAGDKNYLTSLNQLITDINALYAAFLQTTAGAFFSATSTTSNTVGTGSKTWTLAEATERAFAIGMNVRVADSANAANYLEGQITAYSHPTLTVNVSATGGSGTKTAWAVSVAAGSSAITGMGVGTATASQFIRVNSAGNAIIGETLPADGFSDLAFWVGL